jgi:hypothetical protein
MPETSFNTTLALSPFGKQQVFIPELIIRGPAASSMPNVADICRKRKFVSYYDAT